MAENLTPEEQLLKLIEGQSTEQVSPAPAQTPTEASSNEITFPALKPANRGIMRKMVGMLGLAPGGAGIVKLVNRLLVAIMIMMAGYVVWGFANASVPDVGKPPAPDEGILAQPPEIIDISKYLKDVEARDIFNPPKIVVAPPKTDVTAKTLTPEVITPPAKKALDEVAKHFKIVGITWEPAPPMVMIEDSIDNNTRITYCIQEGDSFDTKVQIGEVAEIIKITIKQVAREKITLQYEQEQSEIKANW
ncbi:MAG: hypothetical protein WC980_10635 [Candidatus Brocadiia bacterium]